MESAARYHRCFGCAPDGIVSLLGGPLCKHASANVSQSDLAHAVMSTPLARFLSGYNATTFCYGQTASGKTWTMMGDEARVEHLGIVPRSLITIFDWASTGPRECVIHLSALEIYNETLLDLGRRGDASDFKLEIRESPDIGVHVQNLNHVEVVDIEEASRMVEHVINSRHVSSTEMNERSSRSHLIFQVHLSQVDHGDTERVTERHSVSRPAASFLSGRCLRVGLCGSTRL